MADENQNIGQNLEKNVSEKNEIPGSSRSEIASRAEKGPEKKAEQEINDKQVEKLRQLLSQLPSRTSSGGRGKTPAVQSAKKKEKIEKFVRIALNAKMPVEKLIQKIAAAEDANFLDAFHDRLTEILRKIDTK